MGDLLHGLRVIDLSDGAAGAMTTMLMADHGADVTRIETPAHPDLGPGARVWNRGKRAALLDPSAPGDRDTLHALVDRADVLVESYEPAARAALGLGHRELAARNPALVHCSITAYGGLARHAGRPARDALVAARTGLQYEKRGWPGGGINRLGGLPDLLAGIEPPPGAVAGPDRDGPLYGAVPLPSIGAFYLASIGVNAALRVRQLTGLGQHVETTLLQGAFAALIGGWQRFERPGVPGLQTWIFDGRAPLGIHRCADGRWIHNWVPNPAWILAMGELDDLDAAPDDVVVGVGHRGDPTRLGTEPENLLVLHHYHPLMAEAFARHPADAWERAAARKGTPLQIVRPPRAALADPWWLADGCVAELDDPDEGPIRVVGRTYTTGPGTGHPRGPAPRRGEHTAEVAAAARAPLPRRPGPAGAMPTAPLAGVRVLDLGLAIAGPYGCQLLGDLGADVVKINALHDGYWQTTHIAMTANRNKRSLAINLKDPRGMDVLRRMVAAADVVQHNMRYDAAVRLGVDEDSLRAINPSLVYCHTRGFENTGPRTALPGNDQTGATLAGVEWEEGGMDDGGRPVWSRVNFGDTGNGFLSAIGIIQALAHRDRTGEGTRVDTSIVYAQLLSASATYLRADGTEPDRPRLDADHLGVGPRTRLYRCGDGRWLCVDARPGDEAAALARVTGTDPAAGDAALAKELEAAFATAPAREWLDRLDAAGVPAEISDETFALGVFDDPELAARGWIARLDHPYTGLVETTGLGVDLSATPGVLRRATPVVGQHSREILTGYGIPDAEIDELVAAGVVRDWQPGEPVLP